MPFQACQYHVGGGNHQHMNSRERTSNISACVLANVAYGQVKMESTASDNYEEVNTLVGVGEPVFATADKTTATTTQRRGTLQWNPSKADTIGTKDFVLYREVSLILG